MTQPSTVPTRRPARPRGRPTGGQVIVDRAQLLDAAAQAIREHGPDVTMEDLAAAATVTKPILYRTIGDKAALTTALAEILLDRIDAAVTTTPSQRHGPRDEFDGAIRGYLSAVDIDRNLFLFVNGGAQDTDVVRRLVERSAAQMIESFGAARRSADRDPSAARTWAYAIVGALQIVTLMWLRDEYCDLDTVADDFVHLLWPGVSHAAD